MSDPQLNQWPLSGMNRRVVKAEAQPVGDSPTGKVHRVCFLDSAGKQLAVQLPDTALRNLVETGAELLGLSILAKATSPAARK